MKLKLKNKGGEYGELSEWSTRKKNVYVFLDFRVIIIKKEGDCRSKLHDDDSSMNQEVLMMTKCPKEWFQDWVNKFKIKINFKIHYKKSRRFKIQEKLISRFKKRHQEESRFKRRWIQYSREESKKQKVKTSQGKYWKRFFKNQT